MPWQRLGHAPRAQRADVADRAVRGAHDFARRSPRCSSAKRTRSTANAARPAPAIRRSGLRTARARVRPAAPTAISRSMPVSSGRSIRMRDDALHLPPQPERIARAGRLLARREQPDDRVELVGQRHRRPRHRRRAELRARRRRVRFDADRQVLVVDGLPDLLGLPFLARVDAAHRPLQLGELEHHVGREIGLREPRRRGRVRPPRPACPNASRGDPLAPALDALGLVAIAAELLVEEHRVQPLEPRLERGLAIRFPEELRIAQPRGDDALGVLRDQPLVRRLRVDDGEERFLQLAAFRRRPGSSAGGAPAWSISTSCGSARNAAIEEAGHDAGILDEIGDLVDQRGVLLAGATRPPQPPRVRLELARDAIAALRVIEDDEVLGEPRAVLVEAADLDRAAGAAARRQEAMAVGQRAGLDVLHQRTGGVRRRGRS